MRITYTFTLALIVALCSCEFTPQQEVATTYNPTDKIAQIDADIKFWEGKINTEGNNITYSSKLASAYTAQFGITAEISSLKKAEVLYLNNLEKAPDNCNALRALAQNYVSQHRFLEAKALLEKATDIGEDIRYTDLLMYDVSEELAENEKAEIILSKLEHKKDFNYLIREAKNQDKKGDLDMAITLLEEAKTKAELSKNKGQLTWIYSNMGDFYGHAGRLNDSKASFKKALELDPSDWYSYKGLAYMAWADKNDSKTALAMIENANAYNSDPSLILLKADITEHNGNPSDANIMRAKVYDKVSAEAYGNMYNSFMVHHNLSINELELAEKIAMTELGERQTPSSYALVAATKHQQQKYSEALEIAIHNVIGKTYEPKILLEILPATAQVDSLKKGILSEIDKASYELGPLAFNKLDDY